MSTQYIYMIISLIAYLVSTHIHYADNAYMWKFWSMQSNLCMNRFFVSTNTHLCLYSICLSIGYLHIHIWLDYKVTKTFIVLMFGNHKVYVELIFCFCKFRFQNLFLWPYTAFFFKKENNFLKLLYPPFCIYKS